MRRGAGPCAATAPTQRCVDVAPPTRRGDAHSVARCGVGAGRAAQTVELRNPTVDFAVRRVDRTSARSRTSTRTPGTSPCSPASRRTGVVARAGQRAGQLGVPAGGGEDVRVPGRRAAVTHGGGRGRPAAAGEALRVEHATITLRARGTLPETFGGKGSDASALGDCAGDCARNNGEWPAYDPVPTLPPACDFALSTHVAVFGETPAGRGRGGWCSCARAPTTRTRSSGTSARSRRTRSTARSSSSREKARSSRTGVAFIKLSYRAEEKPQVFDGRVTCALTPVRPTRAEREEEKRLTAAPRAAGDVRRAHRPAAAVHAQRARARRRHGRVRRHPPRLAEHQPHVRRDAATPALAEAGARAHEKTIMSRRTAVSRRTRHLRSAWRGAW